MTRYPLAATMLRGAMIEFKLTTARSTRYGHAARHLAECAALAQSIGDHGDAPGHRVYERSLRTVHGHTAAFGRCHDGFISDGFTDDRARKKFKLVEAESPFSLFLVDNGPAALGSVMHSIAIHSDVTLDSVLAGSSKPGLSPTPASRVD